MDMLPNTLGGSENETDVWIFRFSQRCRHAQTDTVELRNDFIRIVSFEAAGVNQPLQVFTLYIQDMRNTLIERFHGLRVDVNAVNLKSTSSKLDRQGQPYITQPHNTYLGLFRCDFFF